MVIKSTDFEDPKFSEAKEASRASEAEEQKKSESLADILKNKIDAEIKAQNDKTVKDTEESTGKKDCDKKEKSTPDPKKATKAEKDKQKTKTESKQAASGNYRLYEQALLMLKYDQLKQLSEKNLRFKNIARLTMEENGNPSEIINTLFKKKIEFDLLSNATSAQISCLVPTLRMYKMFFNKKNGEDKVLAVELPLIQQYQLEDIETIYKDNSSRGGGAGLQSFKMNNLGGGTALTPATTEIYDIEINLFFSDFSELTKLLYVHTPTKEDIEAGFDKSIPVSYSDLFISRNKSLQNSNTLEQFSLKIEIGWHLSKNIQDDNVIFTPEFKREIENMKQEFYLSYISHAIDFDDRAALNVKLRYKTYLDAANQNPGESNILYDPQVDGDDEIKKLIQQRNLKSEQLSNLKDEQNSQKNRLNTEIENINASIQEKSKPSIENKYRRLIDYIYEEKRLYYIVLNNEDFQNYESSYDNLNKTSTANKDLKELESALNSLQTIQSKITTPNQVEGTLSKLPQGKEEIGKQIEQNSISVIKELTKSNQKFQNLKIIPFFYLGDLLDAVLSQNPNDSGQFIDKKFKVITGPMLFYDFGDITRLISADSLSTGIKNINNIKENVNFNIKGKIVNIADIPISLSLYHQWFIDEIINSGKVIMTFHQFIVSILENLVKLALVNNVYPWAPSQPTEITTKQTIVDRNPLRWEKESGTKDTDYSYEKHFKINDSKCFHKQIKKNEVESLEYIYYITAVNMEAGRFSSNYEEDMKVGVRHMFFNNSNGFIKSIKFTREKNQALESSYVINDKASLQERLVSGKYNAKVSMMGNSFFRVGEYVYIDPYIGAVSKKLIDQNITNPNNVKNTLNSIKDLGIGGYYMVTRIDTKMGIGNYETDVDLKRQFQGDNSGESNIYRLGPYFASYLESNFNTK